MIRRGDRPRMLVVDGAVRSPLTRDERDGPLDEVLDAAGPLPEADHGTVHSGDGLFTASIPLEVLRGASVRDGRLSVENPPTKCWLVKDVVRIELTDGPRPDSVPSY